MNKDVKVLERVTIFSPFGLRFRDLATASNAGDENVKTVKLESSIEIRFRDVNAEEPADDGLLVVAYSTDNPLRRIRAYMNRRGVYVLRDLPGFKEIIRETPPRENTGTSTAYEEFVKDNPKPRTFVLEVMDKRRRYQPFQLPITVPNKGLYQWNPGGVESPPSGHTWIPLFSAPSRQAPAGMAVVRAALWDPVARIPAAWALVEVIAGGKVLGRGMSGDDGQVSIIFPYPAPNTPLPDGSPVSSNYTPILQQTWDLSLQAYYLPETPVPEVPDLVKVFWQAPARLWSDSSTSAELGVQKLKFRDELIVRSESQSNLLITPMSSP